MPLHMAILKQQEVKHVNKNEINHKKARGYDLITSKVLHELPQITIKIITHICNSFVKTDWKIAKLL